MSIHFTPDQFSKFEQSVNEFILLSEKIKDKKISKIESQRRSEIYFESQKTCLDNIFHLIELSKNNSITDLPDCVPINIFTTRLLSILKIISQDKESIKKFSFYQQAFLRILLSDASITKELPENELANLISGYFEFIKEQNSEARNINVFLNLLRLPQTPDLIKNIIMTTLASNPRLLFYACNKDDDTKNIVVPLLCNTNPPRGQYYTNATFALLNAHYFFTKGDNRFDKSSLDARKILVNAFEPHIEKMKEVRNVTEEDTMKLEKMIKVMTSFKESLRRDEKRGNEKNIFLKTFNKARYYIKSFFVSSPHKYLIKSRSKAVKSINLKSSDALIGILLPKTENTIENKVTDNSEAIHSNSGKVSKRDGNFQGLANLSSQKVQHELIPPRNLL